MKNWSIVKKYKLTDRILWIFCVFFFWYLIVGDGIIGSPIYSLFRRLKVSDSMHFVLEMYTATIGGVIAFFILCIFRKNRGDVLHAVLPNKKNKELFQARHGSSARLFNELFLHSMRPAAWGYKTLL